MTNISSPWLFSTWGIDIVAPLPPGKKKVKFLVVVVDYFMKWVEAKPLVVITEAKIQHFVYRFGILRVIISDNERRFDSSKFRDFYKKLGIKIIIPPPDTHKPTDKPKSQIELCLS